MNQQLQSYIFAAPAPGARLLVLGAVHGNEICGPAAIRRVIAQLESGELKLQKGRVTFVPICNPQAYEKDVRYVDENLNRNLGRKHHPVTYEAKIGNELCGYLEDCDVLLDLHSFTAPGVPFIATESGNPSEMDFAWSLGVGMAITGWLSAHQKHPIARKHASFAVGTTEYARQHGAIAVTLECGQHRDLQAPEVGFRAIRGALAHLGMIAAGPTPTDRKRHILFEEIHFKEEPGSFTKDWRHLDPVKKGEVIARTDSGKVLAAPDDGFVIMPKADVAIGYEWFYWGREQKP